jgi:hypothetical protein
MHLVIPIAKLHQAIDSGCKACALLQAGISQFAAIVEVREVMIVVDCALYIYALPKVKSAKAVIIEIYTAAGMCSPHLWPNSRSRSFRKADTMAEHRAS